MAGIEQFHGPFYGVYLLCSQSMEKRYHGKCYIGFTVNPNRRLNQHNRGKDFGGARKTSNKGPWQMVMIVHGFPNNLSALQFEWAWQNPSISTRLKTYTELKRKRPKETYFAYNFRILSRMLSIGPWYRLSLTIRWLDTDYKCDFPLTLEPPSHMLIISGNVAVKKLSQAKSNSESQPCAIWAPECHLCMQHIENTERSRVGCLNKLCKLTCHITCLASYIIASDPASRGHYVPIAGMCPICNCKLIWVEVLQRKHKMQGIAEEDYSQNDTEDDKSSEFSEENESNSPIYELSD